MPTDNFALRMIGVSAFALDDIARYCQFVLAFYIIATPAMTAAATFTEGRERVPLSPLLTGDYIWKPEISPAGPVVIIVSVPEQVLYVYRNGVRIGRSTVSTGKPGHTTPTGVFTVLEKEAYHRSNLYHGAPMPYMERVTWGGVALHAGQLPGYPASHGCVRLPMQFAEKLYTITEKGTTVIVADERSAPRETVHPGLLFSSSGSSPTSPALVADDSFWKPELAPSGPITIIVSTANGAAFVFQSGVEIGRAPVTLPKIGPIGIQVFTALDKLDADGHREWLATNVIGAGENLNIAALAKQSSIPPDFIQNVRAVVKAGTTLILSDLPVSSSTQSKPGFKILNADARLHAK